MELSPGLRASTLCLRYLLAEELVECFGDLLRRPSLDDLPVRHAMAQELGQAGRAAQDDVGAEPAGLLSQALRKCPMRDESRQSGLASDVGACALSWRPKP